MKIRKNSTISKVNKASAPTHGERIGMDITPYAIHTVLLSARSVNQIRLEKYAVTPLPPNVISDNSIEDHDQFVACLQQSMRQLGSNCKNIIVALPQNLASLQVLQYDSRQTELSTEEFVEFEVSQTAMLEDSYYDYSVFNQNNQGTVQDILLASCKRDDVDVRLDAFTAANIIPRQMDVDVVATLNAVNTWINLEQPALAEQNLAVFQINHHTTSALISRHGCLLYKQSINLGHSHLMQIIRRNYQLGEKEAWDMVHAADKPSDFAAKAGNQFQEQMAQEIQRLLQFYYTTGSSSHGSEIQQILVCGYPDRLQQGMAEHIARQVGIATQQINPITAAQPNPRLDNEQFLNDGRLLTVAFGLAVRGL